ncbi:hypothetical protein PHISCL_03281 [Aspergillus sclerotialis]|uniref:C2H2-type domain-containing protein n=1 Tax=Aspergillus sclerotialis TaxID=2070753 RepID=A0A3A2ZMK1_9EURO|nr:hypothetical protein PHISCL_03281 [Aspergillus sclerotialis]
MDWTPTSFPSPESQAQGPEDETWATTPANQPSIHQAPYYLDSFQTPFGLGISLEGTEAPFDQTTFYPPPYPSPPVPNWSCQMGLSEPFHKPMLSGSSELGMDYLLFPNPSIDFYGSQGITASSSYGASLASTPDRQQTILAFSPYSEDTPPNFTQISEGVNGFHGEPSFPDAQNTADMSFYTQMPQPPANAFPTPPPDSNTSVLAGQTTYKSPEATVKSLATETSSGTQTRGLKRSSASRLSCNICGYKFTRASNCRDHQRKAHDPNYQRFYCRLCDVGCKRMWDLRRHEQVM